MGAHPVSAPLALKSESRDSLKSFQSVCFFKKNDLKNAPFLNSRCQIGGY